MIRRARLACMVSIALWLVPIPSVAEEHTHPTPTATNAIVRTPRPPEAKLYIISPKDGETVKSPVVVRFGLTAMGVAPAGVATVATGHHHLIVDAPLPPLDLPFPKDEHHQHFGGGQTETAVELAPGKHTLQIVLGDKDHVPHDPPLVSEKITVTVE